MSRKKFLALAVMLVALVAIFAGISYVNNYTTQKKWQTPVSTQSVVVPENGRGYFFVNLNASVDNYYFRMLFNGTVRQDLLLQSVYPSWVNGSYKPAYSGENGPGSPLSSQYCPIPGNAFPEPFYFIYWNPYSNGSVEVKIEIVQQWTAPVCNNLNLGFGISLLAAGAVSGLAAAFSVSRRLLLVVIALTLIVSGVFLVTTNLQKFSHEEIVATNSLAVPAGGCVNESVSYNATGFHYFMLRVDNGTMNSTVLSVDDFALFSKGQYEPYWQNWRGAHGIGGTVDEVSTNQVYLVLSNPQGFDKQVTVQIYRAWDEYNYFDLAGGALLIAVGAFVFFFANKSQIANFNKALENQE